MSGELKRALIVIRELLGPSGCCCTRRDRARHRTVRGHCLRCYRARRFLTAHGVDVETPDK